MIKIYHAGGSRSCRVRWLLEELGIDYQLETLAFGDGSMQAPEYLAKNPLGKVPTIEDDGLVLYESGAIVEYVLEKYGEGRLAPAPGKPERAPFLQWLHWAEATVVPPLGEIIGHSFMLPEDQRVPAAVPNLRARLDKCFKVLDDELTGKEYLVGGEFSAADIMMGYSVQLAKLTGQLGAEFTNVNAYIERLSARPAFQKAFGA